MSEKIMANDVYCYTLADLEQARKQGAEDERVRCIFQFDKLYESIESSNDSARFDRMDTLIKCVNAVRALGPIGETREETERRVVDATIKYLLDHGYCDDDVWAELDKDELIKAMRGK